MKIVVTHSSAFDFKKKLYEPLRNSALNSAHEIFLPHEDDNSENGSKEKIQNADVVLAEVSLPSTGQGIELGWANTFGKPIVCLHEKGSTPSSALRFVTNTFIEYESESDMLQKLESALSSLQR